MLKMFQTNKKETFHRDLYEHASVVKEIGRCVSAIKSPEITAQRTKR
jgi:hypothetical protein